LTNETQTSILETDLQILEQIQIKQEEMIELIENYISYSSYWDSSLKKFLMIELLMGKLFLSKRIYKLKKHFDLCQ
jgi:hypothetical protein